MPNYQIFYLDAAGQLLSTVSMPCAGDKQAKILAHAMRCSGTKRFEVWNAARLVYERPQTHHLALTNPPPQIHAAE